MYAIVIMGKGKWYMSPVFGVYQKHTKDPYKDYQTRYYVVWDEHRIKLMKWYAYQPNTRYIHQQILVVDWDTHDWEINEEDDTGGVTFLPEEVAADAYERDEMTPELRKQCLEYMQDYTYDPYPEVKNETDIRNLQGITGYFHDACIEKTEMQEDGRLYVYFTGIWGCNLEIWFWGDVEYSTESVDPKYNDPYWVDSTILIQDGFIYLVDECDMKVEDISEGYCYFKARHMQYHVIPRTD